VRRGWGGRRQAAAAHPPAAIRQAIAKSLVAYYQKFVDEHEKKQIKDCLLTYDRTLLVADPRRCEPKKFGGRGARAKYQKARPVARSRCTQLASLAARSRTAE